MSFASVLKKKSFAVCVAAGEGCAIVLTLLLMLPMAGAVYGELLTEEMAWLCGPVAAAVSVFVPTLILAKIRKRQLLAIGGAIALGYVLLAALLCALGGGRCAFGMWLCWLAVAAAVGGLAGALLCVRQNTHKRRRR